MFGVVAPLPTSLTLAPLTPVSVIVNESACPDVVTVTIPVPLGLSSISALLRVLIVPGTVNDPSLLNVKVLVAVPAVPTTKLT